MAFETHPVTPDRVGDFVAVVNPNRRASHCWCLSHRMTAGEIAELGNGSREAAFEALCARTSPPGVVGYDDGEPVGWCSIGPRAMFEKAGFAVAGGTGATASKLPRLVMRRMI